MSSINVNDELNKFFKSVRAKREFSIGYSGTLPIFYTNGLAIVFNRFEVVEGQVHFHFNDVKTGFFFI